MAKRIVDFKKMREDIAARKNANTSSIGVNITDEYKGKNSGEVLKCERCGRNPRKRGTTLCDECKEKQNGNQS